jgi:hypothetical protein
MTLNPDVHQKAQRVIDEQMGRDRLIEPSDRENLPYITCLRKEVLRYVHPTIDKPQVDPFFSGSDPVPLGKCHAFRGDGTRSSSEGVPHLIQDDGYLLPEGSSVFLNFWLISYQLG